MATLTVKNAPQPLVRRLKARATLHRRSLNREVIACLEGLAQAAPGDAEALLARAREVRHTPAGGPATRRGVPPLKTARGAGASLLRIFRGLRTGAGRPRAWP